MPTDYQYFIRTCKIKFNATLNAPNKLELCETSARWQNVPDGT